LNFTVPINTFTNLVTHAGLCFVDSIIIITGVSSSINNILTRAVQFKSPRGIFYWSLVAHWLAILYPLGLEIDCFE
jgi:hypothetical protein